jgi:predicted cupin superfamily sugar epimerase
MRTLLAAAVLAAGMVAPLLSPGRLSGVASLQRANAAIGTEARASELIQALKLRVLPKESGYLGIIGVSAQKVPVDGRTLAVQSQNYYMLTRERPINYLHRLVPDDTHILIEGGPVDYFIFHANGRAEKITLGMDLAAGERPVVAVPAGCWKALRLRDGAAYALMANMLSPEFTPDRSRSAKARPGSSALQVRRRGPQPRRCANSSGRIGCRSSEQTGRSLALLETIARGYVCIHRADKRHRSGLSMVR